MNHITAELDQTDEDILYEVSDETLEAAAGHLHRRPIHEDCWTNGRDGGMRLTWKIKDRRSTKAAITPTSPFSEPIPKVVDSDESFVIRYAAPESSTGGCRDVET